VCKLFWRRVTGKLEAVIHDISPVASAQKPTHEEQHEHERSKEIKKSKEHRSVRMRQVQLENSVSTDFKADH
jgi:hypothetical protein